MIVTGRLVSPNEMHDAAKKAMLDGRNPVTPQDWAKIVNFYAANVDHKVGTVAVKFLAHLMECPLPDEAIEEISEAQLTFQELQKIFPTEDAASLVAALFNLSLLSPTEDSNVQ
jgi:hypothetical protein